MNTTKSLTIGTLFVAAIAAPSFAHSSDLLTTIVEQILAQTFKVKPAEVVNMTTTSGLDVYDTAPIYSTAYYSHQTPEAIWTLRRQGWGWHRIWTSFGLSEKRYVDLSNAGAFDRDRIWGSISHDRYGMPTKDIYEIQRQGGTYRDFIPISIIYRQAKVQPRVIYLRYKANPNWQTVASKYRVDMSKHTNYAVSRSWNGPVRTIKV